MERPRSGRPQLSKTRVNLALGEKLVVAAKAHADRAEMTLSELVAYLLRRASPSPVSASLEPCFSGLKKGDFTTRMFLPY
ncbi:MAG: DUF6364 family protein [bacterium]